jgi:NADPH:quinone reductase-like Zn-dependent oxidoreductase
MPTHARAFSLAHDLKNGTLNGERLRAAMAALANWIIHDRIKAPACRTMPLAEAAQAHTLMERCGFTGRLLLVP